MTTQNPPTAFPSRTFPNHKYDFDDSVFIRSTGEVGIVSAIWYRNEDSTWLYALSRSSQPPEQWWEEAFLEPDLQAEADASNAPWS